MMRNVYDGGAKILPILKICKSEEGFLNKKYKVRHQQR